MLDKNLLDVSHSVQGERDETKIPLHTFDTKGENLAVVDSDLACRSDPVCDLQSGGDSKSVCSVPMTSVGMGTVISEESRESKVMDNNGESACVKNGVYPCDELSVLDKSLATMLNTPAQQQCQNSSSDPVKRCQGNNESMPQCLSVNISEDIKNQPDSLQNQNGLDTNQCQNALDLEQSKLSPVSPGQLQLVPYHQSSMAVVPHSSVVPHMAVIPQTAVAPQTAVVSQGAVVSQAVTPQSVVTSRQQPLIMPQHPQAAQSPPTMPYVYVPQPYMPFVYQYPPTTASHVEAAHLQQQLQQPYIAQHNQPMPPLQYPAQHMWPYYQPTNALNYSQAPTQQVKSYQPPHEAQVNQPTVVLQQNMASHGMQNQQPTPAPAPQGQVYATQLQRTAHVDGNSPQNLLAMQHTQPSVMLHHNHPGMYQYQPIISEGQTNQPAPPSVGTFSCINPHPAGENRAEVRLQGPHHLFTVVPVGSGDLKEAQEEEAHEEEPLLPLRKSKQPVITPLKNFRPTLPPITPTPPISPINDTFQYPQPVPSPLAARESKTATENAKKGTSSLSESTSTTSSTDLPMSGRPTASSTPTKKLSHQYHTVGGNRIILPKHNPYHTVAVSSPAHPRRDIVRVGGLGPSPFHPRGEYGVGGLPLPTRKEICMKSLPRNPYHTITGMISPTHSMREYGVGGRYSPITSMREDGRGIPPPLSQREYGKNGIPPSLAPLVLTRTNNSAARAARNTVKHLSWGYTVSTPHNHKGRSISLRQLNTQRWSMNVPEGTAGETPAEGVSSPLLQSSDQATAETSSSTQAAVSPDAHQLTVRSMGGIEVGSTDGQYLTVCGALTSPEQLPFLPSVFRNGHLESCKNTGLYIEVDPRQTWGNKAQFVLACIGYAVGLGNLWRFPYLCYKSGGGAFLIPYFLMLFLCGIPLLLMELAIGQYTRRGPIGALEKLCPIFKGAGVGTVIMSFLLGTYYNVIIAWAIYYLFQSFTSELPWSKCDPSWSVNCYDDYGSNVTVPNGTKSATEEFFDVVVLQKSSGMAEMGSFRLELLFALFGAWVLVYFCLWKSVKSSGKVVYVTATLPYLLIGAFLWRAVTLPGAAQGLQYFFNPRWELLLDGQVWVAAAAQNFNSIGIAFGSLIAFSSYNKFNNNITLDTWAISLTNSFTSLLAGMIVFSTLGNIALEQSKDMDEVVAEGPGLVFMVYPQALAKMPYGGIWAVLFFFMLLVLGLDSQFATIEVIITSLQDGFPKWLKKNLKHHEILVLLVCIVSFLCGLPNVTQGGIYFFKLIDYYAANISLMYLAFFEVVSIVWLYGAGRLARNVQDMTGRLPSLYFRVCWYITAPVLILAIWIFSIVDYERPTYNKGEYVYPDWAIGIGWVIASLSIAPIPVFAVIAIYNAKGANLWEKFKNSFKAQIEECSCCGGVFTCVAEDQNGGEFSDNPLKLVVYSEGENTETKTPIEMAEKKNKETVLNGTTN